MFNFILGSIIYSGSDPNLDVWGLYCSIAGIFTFIAIVIIMQEVLVGEKDSGTAAWILSKPVSRTAFVVSKFVPNAVGTLLSIAFIPAVLTYIHVGFATKTWVNPFNFLAGIGVLGLVMLFYVALTLMLGALFNSRAPVIGIAMAFGFGQQYLVGLLPFLKKILPWDLFMSLGEGAPLAVAPSLIYGEPVDLLPVWSTLALIAIFCIVAIRSFKRTEL